ncbi:C-5 cytosine-specific DNA methylase II [Bacillus phage Deep Blue]|uniref:Cytosine-specific methyltransferase n=1 Tax=Bacillus phage Deep Blue TaxID=1792245 RepID=A0A140HLV7_9CAUD|nr:DNA methyltransferase [Bacillus phage Deep Blue]AMO25969.1 C-5 cytosine-specific DNA methylase II [Bacillus phage Deep Blue]
MEELRVVELFAGYGSQSMALKRANINYKTVAIAEIDEHAINSYEAIHSNTYNLGDITKVEGEDVPDHDFLTYSFPCTDISVSGAMKGLLENSGTSSSTLWDVKRVIEAKKPSYLMMENVDNLVIKFMDDYLLWLAYLNSQGYTTTWRVIDSETYVPQRRKRVIAISQLNGQAFLFPKDPEERTYDLIDVLEDLDDAEALESFKDPSVRSATVDPVTYYNPNSDYYKLQPENSRASFIGYIGNQPKQATRVYEPITASTLTANGGGQGGKTGLYHLGTHIRNLSPLEAWRVMGVSDEDFYKAQAVGTKKTQLLRQAGNSIVVDIMVPIFEKLFKNYMKETN